MLSGGSNQLKRKFFCGAAETACARKAQVATCSAAICLASVLLCGTALPAVAQGSRATGHGAVPVSAASAKTGGALGVEEVVVTARRRVEKLANVPETVAAISADALIEQGIATEADLQTAVPGLIVRSTNNSDQLNYVIRGESVDAYSGSPPGVQPYIDDVPITANTPTAFYDLGGVQVVKGPQGTLFGRNTTGGAVLFQTQQPKNAFGGYMSVRYGNFDRFVAQGAIDIPLVSDKALLRVAGTTTSGGAFVRNLYDGRLLGDRNEQSGRLTLELRPSNKFTNVTTAQFTHIGGTVTPDVAYYVVPCGQQGGFDSCQYSPSVPAFNKLINGTSGVFPGYPSGYVYPGGLAALPAFLRSQGPYVIDDNSTFGHKANNTFVINTSTYELSSSASIKNIFGYSYAYNAQQYDDDHSPYLILTSAYGVPPYETEKTLQYSDELQILGNAFENRLSYIFGLFYFTSDDYYYSPISGTFIVPPDTIGTFSVAYHALTQDTSYAFFGQATYKIADQLNLTLGGRGTWEDIKVKQLQGSVFGTGIVQSATQSNPSWTASLDYHISPDLMVYLATRGSWRRGGFNPFAEPVGTKVTAAGGGNYFLPETVKDVEIGAKFDGRLAGMPMRADMDVYHSWIDNLQKTAYVVIAGHAASAAVNVPATEISGIEGDFNLFPTDWLRVGGTLSYNYGDFTQPKSILFGLPATFGPFGDMPRYSGTLFGEVVMQLPGDIGSLTYHTDLYAQSSFYFSNLNNTLTPGTKLPGYALVNMRLDWTNIFGNAVTASVYVKNLTNKTYYTGGNAAAQDYSVEAAAWGMPRTYGFSVRYEF